MTMKGRTTTLLILAILVSLTDASVGPSAFAPLTRPTAFQTRPTAPSSRSTSQVLALARGGSTEEAELEDYSDEEEEEFDEDFDEEFDDDELFDALDDDLDEADFAEDTSVDLFLAAIKKTPPITKAFMGASVAATLYGCAFNQNKFPELLQLDWKKVVTRLHIWRPFTSFLNFGSLGLGYLLTSQFVWQYMSTLERINHDRPYDFLVMLLFGSLSMLIGYPILRLSPKFLGHNLSTFLVYIWSRYHEGVEVNLMELFNAKAELLPWFFLGQTFLLEGELPVLDFLGIVFGHIYHHCKTVGILRAPESLTEWYETSEAAAPIRELYRPIASDFVA